ncbi:hypothetical protein PG989_015485 [Apiospora arundinis]
MMTGEAVTPPVTIFLRSILGNPHLAAYVQTLRLAGDDSFYDDWRFHESLPKLSWNGTGSTLDRAVSLVTELPLPYTQAWVRGLQEGTMDAIIALILTRLPNLRSLVTTANFTKEMTLQGAMFHSALCGQNRVGWLSHFDQLGEVCADFYRSYNHGFNPNTDILLSLFYLPAIQTLDLLLDNPAKFSWPAATAPDTTSLTSLTLRHVRESALKEILSCTKRLIKLDWQFLYSERNMSTQYRGPRLYPPIADLDVLVDALAPVRNTLKDLTIRADAIQPAQLDYEELIEVRGSLEGLVEFNVERLQVPLTFLAGRLIPNNRFRVSERIPKTVRTLVIGDDLRDFGDMFLDEDDWDRSEIALNLRDWLCEGLGSTPFIEQLELGMLSDTRKGQIYCILKRLLDKEQIPVKITLRGKEPEPESA